MDPRRGSEATGALPWRSSLLPALIGWGAYAFLYFSFCFRPGLVHDDDFGYLRSVLGTLQHGRIYTYEWLEPFGAVFTLCCSALYKLTGNFYLSTYGFQALCALAFYPLLHALLSKRLRPDAAALSALIVATFPVLLAKASGFHGCLCTLDLFLAALIFFEAGKLGWFFVFAFLAFANRQNHVCLLILPLWTAGEAWMRGRRVTWPILLGVLPFLAGGAGLYLYMNRTYAAANAVFLHSPWRTLATSGALSCFAGAAVSLGLLSVFRMLLPSGAGSSPWSRERWRFPLCAGLVLLALVPLWRADLIRTDTPLFGFVGWGQVNRVLPWLILISFRCLDARLLRPRPYLALIGGYLLIASVRGIWWDYYFLEIAILAILLVADDPSIRNRPGVASRKPAYAIMGLLLLGNTAYAYFLKIQMDKQWLAVTSMERLERQGGMTVDRMTGATFGYLGWKLFDYFIANEGRDYGELADFLGYVRRDRVVVETGLPWRHGFKAALPAGAEILDEGTCRVGFARVKYRIADLHGPQTAIAIAGRSMILDPSRYRSPRFPLRNGEWKAWLDSARAGAASK